MESSTCSDIHEIVNTISEYLYPFTSNLEGSVKQQQETLYEFYKFRNERNPETGKTKEILEWIHSLDEKKLQKILTLDNKTLAQIIQEMSDYKNSPSGRFGFSLYDLIQKRHYSYYIDSFFKAELMPFDSLTVDQNEAENEFESLIRFCDKNEYCNTLTICPGTSIHKLLDLMKIISKEQSFLVPCRVFWDNESGSWIWDYPNWFNAKNSNTVSAFVCASFERSLWIHFWNENKFDPKVQGEKRVYKRREMCDSFITDWTDLYLSIGKRKLKELFSDSELHGKIFMNVTDDILKKKRLEFEKQGRHVLFTIKSGNVESDINETRIISKNFATLNRVAFNNFLFFTPLSRVGTNLDISIRKLIIMMREIEENKRQIMVKDIILKPIKEIKIVKKKKKCENTKKNTVVNYQDNAMSRQEDFSEELKEESNPNPEINKKKKKKKKKKTNKVVPQTIQNDSNSDSTSINSCHDTMKTKIREVKNSQKNCNLHENLHLKDPQKNCNPSQNLHLKYPQKNCNLNEKGNKKLICGKAFSLEQPPKTNEPSPLPSAIPDSTRQPVTWNISENPSNQNLDIKEFPLLSANDNFLHAEILLFCKELEKKVNEKYERFASSLSILMHTIRESFSVDNIEIYGSHSTKIALESSDIDLVVRLLELPNADEVKKCCDLLAFRLSNCPIVTQCKSITTSKVPVVKVVTEQYPLDITFESKGDSHLGISTMEFIKINLLLYPNLKEIYLLCKQLLYVNELNSSYTKGVSSYGLFIWVLSFFQKYDNKLKSLGEIFLSFLNYFGVEFNPKLHLIDVKFDCSGFPLEKENPGNIITLEPHSRQNITENCYKFEKIQELFKKTYRKIMEMKSQYSNQNILNYIFNLEI